MPLRTRIKGNPNVPSYVAGTSALLYTNSPTESSTFNGSRTGVYEEMTDVVTPGFRRRISRGDIVNNYMQRRVYKYTATPMLTVFGENPPTNVGGKLRYRQEYWNLLALSKGPLRPPVHPTQPTGHLLYGWQPTLDHSSLESKAATAALSSSLDEGAQGLVILAEMRKTLATLRNPLAAVSKHLDRMPARTPRSLKGAAWRRFSGKVAKEAAVGASSQYLTWFYGLRTLMFDIEEIIGVLGRPGRVRKTGRGYAEDETLIVTTEGLNAGTGSHNATVTTEYRERCEVRAGALAQIEAIADMQRFGFKLSKIPETVWELTPMSFVFDWFVNIQQVIGAYEAVVTNKFLAQWVVKKWHLTWTRTVGSHLVLPLGQPWLTLLSPCTDGDQVVVEMYDRVPQELSWLIRPTVNFSFSKVPELAAISLVVQKLLTKGKV